MLNNSNNNQLPNLQNGQRKTFHDYVYPNGRGQDSDLIEMIEKEMLDLTPNVSFDQIAGLELEKQELKEAVLLPIKFPEIFNNIRRPCRRVLLFGPSGTGKTTLVKALAAKEQTTFFNVPIKALGSKWKGDQIKVIKIIFEMAKYLAPSIIFFDEIDFLGGSKEERLFSDNRVKTETLIQLDNNTELSNEENKKLVMFIAATNCPQNVDVALIRRFEKRIYIPLPNLTGIGELIKIYSDKLKWPKDIDWNLLVKQFEGFSCTDVANVLREAQLLSMKRQQKKEQNQENFEITKQNQILDSIDRIIEVQDIEEALKTVNKSASDDYLKQLQIWMQNYYNY